MSDVVTPRCGGSIPHKLPPVEWKSLAEHRCLILQSGSCFDLHAVPTSCATVSDLMSPASEILRSPTRKRATLAREALASNRERCPAKECALDGPPQNRTSGGDTNTAGTWTASTRTLTIFCRLCRTFDAKSTPESYGYAGAISQELRRPDSHTLSANARTTTV